MDRVGFGLVMHGVGARGGKATFILTHEFSLLVSFCFLIVRSFFVDLLFLGEFYTEILISQYPY